MLKKMISILLFSLIVLFISGCNGNDSDTSSNNNAYKEAEVTAIADLENTEHFREHALSHVLEGELNQKEQAVGFHYNQLPSKHGEIVNGTKTTNNEQGVYEAEVVIEDVKKQANGGKSTFFPDDWDTQDVVDAINEAYEAKTFINGNTYEGLTKDGIEIRMYLDQNDKIISAFPIY